MHGERLRVIGTADHARKWARVEAGLETARLGKYPGLTAGVASWKLWKQRRIRVRKAGAEGCQGDARLEGPPTWNLEGEEHVQSAASHARL
jgi:hypothetical protein